jgi:signal peptidase
MLPMAMLVLTASLFDKKKKNAVRKGRKLGLIGTVLTVAIIVSVAMLVSCQFRFGALVIATESMTGEINKGDAIIYEEYDDQYIKEQDVIVFLKNDNRIVHRVVLMERINGETRYYTKGDANDDWDTGYITDADIEGVVLFKIPYVGYTSIWLRDVFKK